MKIALDAMGGDKAPVEIVKGALLAVKEFPDIEVALVGLPSQVEAELRKHPAESRITVVPAAETISMDQDDVAREVRRRPEASINIGMNMVKDGSAAAFVSAGNTGAVMASAFFLLGRIRGIERPALATMLPFNAGRVLLIDAGANADPRPQHIVQFAQMGAAYLEKVVGVKNPRIGLLNVGEEASKGNELAQETYQRLQETSLNFIGNVEGVQVHKGYCDVVVTDGFTGNVSLKVGEGIADYILEQVTLTIKSSLIFIAAAVLLKPALKKALKRLQYEEYGGASLLGVNGLVVIAHGRSDAIAIKNALRFARMAAGSDLMVAMRESFAATPSGAAAGS